MARTSFRVEVLTPEGEIFDDDVEMLSTTTATGSIGILANHEPLLALVVPTELRLYVSESDVVRFAQGEGFLQVSDSRALLLADEMHDPRKLDAGDLLDRLNRAQDKISRAEPGSEEQMAALREGRRYEVWLQMVAGG